MEGQQTELTSRTAGTRYLELDSLRGLAAFTVVLHHCRIALGYRESPLLWPFFAGRSAVMLFFVLSGFVLSLPYWSKGRNDNYAKYLIRRCFRIYVPYVAAVVVAICGVTLFPHSQLPLGEWFHHTWQTDVTPRLIGRHLLMGGGDELNTAFWSLRYEVQMSIVFPGLLLLLGVVQPAVAIALATAAFIVASMRIEAGIHDPHLLLSTLKFGSLFAIGGVLARCIRWTREGWNKTPVVVRVAALGAALFLYFGYGDWALTKVRMDAPEDLLVSLGACALLVCSMYFAPLRSILHRSIPVYLGRISYSMYLVHATVLFGLLNLLYYRVSGLILALIYLAVTLAASHFFCIVIEEPSLRFGKAIAGRWKGQRV